MHKNPPCLEDNINQILLLAWKSFRDTYFSLSNNLPKRDILLRNLQNILFVLSREKYQPKGCCELTYYLKMALDKLFFLI